MIIPNSVRVAGIMFVGLLITILIISAVNASTGHDAPVKQVSQPDQTSVSVETVTTGEPYVLPDPCGLDAVVCPNEMPTFKQGGHEAGIFTVSAYTSEVGQTDATPCLAADGSDICERYAAGEGICASNLFPMGVQLVVEGLGRCTVADRMNSRHGTNKIDWYMGADTKAAITFGIKKLNVYTIE